MVTYIVLAVFFTIFIFILGIAIGHSIMTLKLRREENHKRDIEEKLTNNRKEILVASEKISRNIDDLIYKANLKREIDKITREQ